MPGSNLYRTALSLAAASMIAHRPASCGAFISHSLANCWILKNLSSKTSSFLVHSSSFTRYLHLRYFFIDFCITLLCLQGTLKLFLLLLHDFPEFLCEYCYLI